MFVADARAWAQVIPGLVTALVSRSILFYPFLFCGFPFYADLICFILSFSVLFFCASFFPTLYRFILLCPSSPFFSAFSILFLSYPILTYPILSHPIPSHPILSYPILSYLILSYLILSHLTPSHLISSHLILSYEPMICFILLFLLFFFRK